MTIQIHINGETANDVIHELSVLASHLSFPNAAAAPEAPKVEKPARNRSTNGGTGNSTHNFVDLTTNQSSIAGNKTFTGSTAKESTSEPEADPEVTKTESSDNVPTVVELRAKAQEVGTTPEAKKAIKSLLDEFGSKSISDVPEEKRAAFLKALEDLA